VVGTISQVESWSKWLRVGNVVVMADLRMLMDYLASSGMVSQKFGTYVSITKNNQSKVIIHSYIVAKYIVPHEQKI